MIRTQGLLVILIGLVLFLPNSSSKPIVSIVPFVIALAIIEILYFLTYIKSKKSKSVSDVTTVVYALLIVWELVTKLGLSHPVLLPSPENVFDVFAQYGQDMIECFISSMKLLLIGIGLAMIFGVLGGLFVGYVKRLRETVLPIARVMSTIPPLVYTPYVVAVMPSFYTASIFVIFSAVFWPSFMSMIAKVGSIDKKIIDSARVMNFSTFGMIFKVILPYSLPDVIGRLSTSLISAMLCLTGAEMLGASSGLGYFVKKYSDYADYTKVIAGIILIGIVTTALNILVSKLNQKVVKWQ